MDVELYLWRAFKKEGFTDEGAAGLMGNIKCEGDMRPNNLENYFNRKTGLSDEEYTAKVNNGDITREQFGKDGYGYGLCQWTWYTRKFALYDLVKERKKSIDDVEVQTEYLLKEIKRDFANIYRLLQTTTSIKEASDLILHKFERPADQSSAMELKRAKVGEDYYNRFHTEVKKNDKKSTTRHYDNVAIKEMPGGDVLIARTF